MNEVIIQKCDIIFGFFFTINAWGDFFFFAFLHAWEEFRLWLCVNHKGRNEWCVQFS